MKLTKAFPWPPLLGGRPAFTLAAVLLGVSPRPVSFSSASPHPVRPNPLYVPPLESLAPWVLWPAPLPPLAPHCLTLGPDHVW